MSGGVVVWLPRPDAGELMGGLPPGVVADVWDGGEVLPASREEVEFYVPAFLAAGRWAAVLPELPRLRVVQLLTAGAEAIAPFVPPGVALCTARGAHSAVTAEWAVAAMLAVVREFPRFVRAQEQARWDQRSTDALAEKTVLIVGYGDIGAALEARLSGFEVDLLRVARRPRPGVHGLEELPRLLPRADVVVLLVPVTDATRGMVDARFLAGMRDGAVLVNAARGSVVDTDALVAELNAGRLRAALDVTDPEPLPPQHPLWGAPNLLLTPHVGGSTPLAAPRAFAVVRAQLERYLAGAPLANVVGEAGY